MSGQMATTVMLLILGMLLVDSEEELYEKTYDNSITEIPSDIPLSVTILNLKRNKITAVPSLAFSNYSVLAHVDLHFNRIAFIAIDAFHGSHIEYLNINDNRVAVTHLLSLESLSQTLSFLDISANPVNLADEIWQTLFTKLTALSRMKLQYLQLEGFPLFHLAKERT